MELETQGDWLATPDLFLSTYKMYYVKLAGGKVWETTSLRGKPKGAAPEIRNRALCFPTATQGHALKAGSLLLSPPRTP
jgi:hypothetical protein